ncbi:dTMP kinase [Catellatospora sichuanensis]|uniref:dTMP kinase n=1 Tax=Catellatospora sichuanensis TaxID=1969805 RepID=UPI00118335EC|nr:dTMP kinase [Catellatospora sichuanensis]
MGVDPSPRWITIDGPGATGKTTTAVALEPLLAAAGHHVLRTQQPSRSPFGAYVRNALRTLDGLPLACVITADRYQHVHTEILPALAGGQTVICDRYVASLALDMLRGVPEQLMWDLHAGLPRPDLAVILSSSPDALETRIAARGPHSRWQAEPGNASREIRAYQAASATLAAMDWPLLQLHTDHTPPTALADRIASTLERLPIPRPRDYRASTEAPGPPSPPAA